MNESTLEKKPTLGKICREFFLMGLVSFGGGMFSLIFERVVHQKNWMSEKEFRECVTISEIAPGPFTLHVVMYVGYHLQGFWGLFLTTLFFSLPSILIVSAMALFQRFFMKGIPGIEAFILGIWAAIFGLMGSTILSIGKKVFRDIVLLFICILAMALYFFLKLNFFMIIGLGGLLLMGWEIFREFRFISKRSFLKTDKGEAS